MEEKKDRKKREREKEGKIIAYCLYEHNTIFLSFERKYSIQEEENKSISSLSATADKEPNKREWKDGRENKKWGKDYEKNNNDKKKNTCNVSSILISHKISSFDICEFAFDINLFMLDIQCVCIKLWFWKVLQSEG